MDNKYFEINGNIKFGWKDKSSCIITGIQSMSQYEELFTSDASPVEISKRGHVTTHDGITLVVNRDKLPGERNS